MKKSIIIIAITAIAIAGAGVGTTAHFLQGGAAKAIHATELSKGEKYLADLNYEQATATLQHVITVEPNNAEAYLALAKTYQYMGDIDTARETLEKGHGATNSAVIERELRELSSDKNSATDQPTSTDVSMIEIAGHSYRVDTAELVLRECGLTDADIKKLSEFTSLERLDISGNGISDISTVAGLTNLKKFYAANNAIADISPLAKLSSLEYIGLRGNQVANADSLFTLSNLKYLHLSDNKMKTVSSVGDNLQLLYLANNQIGDTDNVKNASLLYYDISGNPEI